MNVFAVIDNETKIQGKVLKSDDRIKLVIDSNKIPCDAREVYICVDDFKSKTGEIGYYMCGRDFGQYSAFLTYFTEREDYVFDEKRTLLNCFGVKNNNGTYLGTFSGMEFEYNWKIEKKANEYSFGFYYKTDEINLYEDIIIELFQLDDDSSYIDMAKRYRQYMLEERGCKTLKDRIKTQKTLDIIKDTVEIRVRMAWKPVPPSILEQTIENEPDIYVACTFDDVKKFVKELYDLEVKNAEICLVGWNKSGHDGRWPTTFPVEPLLGGEDKLKELIAYAETLGYSIVCHTNSSDCYSISDYFNDGDITAKDINGEFVSDPQAWSGGKMYHLCPQRAYEIALEQLPKIKDLGFRGTHYIDVISVVPVKKCFDPNHPSNAKQSDEYMRKIANMAKDLFGGFASEGSFDHAANYLDYGLYTKFNREPKVGMDEGIFLWEVVFHGIIMSNDSITTVNYTIKSSDERLNVVRFNSRPAFYIYSKFTSNGNNWMGNDDLVINTNEDIRNSAMKIKIGADEYAKVSNVQMKFIEKYYINKEKVYCVE